MERNKAQKELISTLHVLDGFIEVQIDALRIYRQLYYHADEPGINNILSWLYDEEEMRLRRASVRRRRILERNPELVENGLYKPRQETGVSKMGYAEGLLNGGVLEILRYAINNEVRAMQFFRRKAHLAREPLYRMMFAAAAADQETQVKYYAEKRELIMQKHIEGATLLASRVAG